MAPPRQALTAHRFALAAWRLWPSRAVAPADRRRVAILVMSADAMSGVVRSVFSLGEELAATHDVEIVSVVRRHPRYFFRRPPGVRITTVDDQRARPARSRAVGAVRSLLRRRRGRLVHPYDRWAA